MRTLGHNILSLLPFDYLFLHLFPKPPLPNILPLCISLELRELTWWRDGVSTISLLTGWNFLLWLPIFLLRISKTGFGRGVLCGSQGWKPPHSNLGTFPRLPDTRRNVQGWQLSPLRSSSQIAGLPGPYRWVPTWLQEIGVKAGSQRGSWTMLWILIGHCRYSQGQPVSLGLQAWGSVPEKGRFKWTERQEHSPLSHSCDPSGLCGKSVTEPLWLSVTFKMIN